MAYDRSRRLHLPIAGRVSKAQWPARRRRRPPRCGAESIRLDSHPRVTAHNQRELRSVRRLPCIPARRNAAADGSLHWIALLRHWRPAASRRACVSTARAASAGSAAPAAKCAAGIVLGVLVAARDVLNESLNRILVVVAERAGEVFQLQLAIAVAEVVECA